MEFPCVICANECQNDTIQCSNCKNWVHASCANLTGGDLKSWSFHSLKFRCHCCAFDGDMYDSKAALSRLQTALLSKKKNEMTNTAKSERKLLITYSISPNYTSHVHPTYTIDLEADQILKVFHPAMRQQCMPVTTIGDGNCLYRAVSTAITGNQNNHYLFRLLTSLELIENEKSYQSEFLKDVRLVTSDYHKLLHDSIVVGQFSEIGHVSALSAALSKPIRSYYPPQLETEYTSEPFTRRIIGRMASDTAPSICVMWSMIKAPSNTVNSYMPNHFVPLGSRSVNPQPAAITITDDSLINPLSPPPASAVNDDLPSDTFLIPGYSIKKVDNYVSNDLPTIIIEPCTVDDQVPNECEFHGSLDSGFVLVGEKV